MIRVLGIKSTEKICIPSTWLVDLLREVVEVVSPVVQHLGDDEGAFPRGGKLVRSLLIHLEHKISFLKCSTFDIPGVKSTKILLINSQPNQGHLAFLFQKINGILACLLCLRF